MPPMKAFTGAKSPWAVQDSFLTAASSSSSSCATVFSSLTMSSRTSASACMGWIKKREVSGLVDLFYLLYFLLTACPVELSEYGLRYPVTFTDLRLRKRKSLLFLHKAMEGLESQMQGVVPRYFSIIASYQQPMVRQSLREWFLQFVLQSSY